MDGRTKAISYLSILIGVVAGIATGYFMYTKASARAAELEAEERENAIRPTPRIGTGGSGDEESGWVGDEDAEDGGEYDYSDDPAEREATKAIRDGDGISLHTHEGEGEGAYRDAFSDDGEEGDARSLDHAFRDGDGDEDVWGDSGDLGRR